MTNKAIEELLDEWIDTDLLLESHTSLDNFHLTSYVLSNQLYLLDDADTGYVFTVPVGATTYEDKIEWWSPLGATVLRPATTVSFYKEEVLNDMQKQMHYPIPGHTYIHYKGGRYIVKEIAFSKIEGYDGQAVVVYTSEKDGSTYVRTVEDWLTPVPIPRPFEYQPRFKLED